MDTESVLQSLSYVNEAMSLFDDFILRVLRLQEMHSSSSKFLLGYQHELEKLRQPPLDESSNLVKDVLKNISSSRVASYQELGCRHAQSDRQSLVKLNGFFTGLKDHILRAQSTVEELEKLVEKVTTLMDADLESITAKRMVNLQLEEHNEDFKQVPSCEPRVVALQTSDYALLMSSIFSMLEKDVQMQVLVVSDLGVDVDSECLQTYTQMWCLRPFIDERVLQQALWLVHK